MTLDDNDFEDPFCDIQSSTLDPLKKNQSEQPELKSGGGHDLLAQIDRLDRTNTSKPEN